MATVSTYEYISADRVVGGCWKVSGQKMHMMTQEARAKFGDYTIQSKLWQDRRCYITARADGRKVFDGCYIERREWSGETDRKFSYCVNFDHVVGGHITEELARALQQFLEANW